MTAAEYTQGLRDLIAWIERHPEIEKNLDAKSSFIHVYCFDQESFVEKLALLEGIAKIDHDSRWLNATRSFGPMRVQVYMDINKAGGVTTEMRPVEVTEWEPHPELRPILDAFAQAVPA